MVDSDGAIPSSVVIPEYTKPWVSMCYWAKRKQTAETRWTKVGL